MGTKLSGRCFRGDSSWEVLYIYIFLRKSRWEELQGAIKTTFSTDNSHQINTKKHRILSSYNLHSIKSGYKILLKWSVTSFCKKCLSLSVSGHQLTRFNALTSSASPNILQKLLRLSIIDNTVWLDCIFNSCCSIWKSSSASVWFSVSSSS